MAKKKKGGFILSLIFLGIIAFGTFYVYKKFIAASIHLRNKNYTFIFIEHNDTFEDVMTDINNENIIENPQSFEWLAKKMELDKNIHPGKYRITNGMSMRQIINLIKYNKQEKVKLTYNSQIRNLDEFISYTSDKLELNESDLENYLSDEKKLRDDFRLDLENAFALVIPGVYEVSWAITKDEFILFLQQQYKKVWNGYRIGKAKQLGFSVSELVTLSSIVQSESGIESEQRKIAGVYINRLNTNMLLQADPTLRFANKAFDIQRFWNSDKEINSPYNTYKYKGLPPGPICLVYTQAIDATLNYTKHNYLYFCAKPQLNGYSDFSVNYEQHKKYAEAYQRAMSKRGITR
jgi:UPF0755 protein